MLEFVGAGTSCRRPGGGGRHPAIRTRRRTGVGAGTRGSRGPRGRRRRPRLAERRAAAGDGHVALRCRERFPAGSAPPFAARRRETTQASPAPDLGDRPDPGRSPRRCRRRRMAGPAAAGVRDHVLVRRPGRLHGFGYDAGRRPHPTRRDRNEDRRGSSSTRGSSRARRRISTPPVTRRTAPASSRAPTPEEADGCPGRAAGPARPQLPAAEEGHHSRGVPPAPTILAAVAKATGIPRADLDAAAKDTAALGLPAGVKRAEGYLSPRPTTSSRTPARRTYSARWSRRPRKPWVSSVSPPQISIAC